MAETIRESSPDATQDPRQESQERADLSVIVVAYNSGASIGKTIEHLETVTSELDVEILVIDNASKDDTQSQAESALSRGKVIRSEVNLGFGGGVNLGLRSARGELVLILNDDVLPTSGAIERMMSLAREDSGIGLIGARLVDSNHQPSFSVRTQLPGLRDELARMIDRVRRRNSRVAYPDGKLPVDVGMMVCACVMAQTDLLRELGGFNSAFFMYGEDIDLCRRLRDHNLRLLSVPGAVAVHQREIAPERRYENREFTERILGARDVYYRIWLGRLERVVVHIIRAFGLADQPFRLRYHLRKALWDGPNLSNLRRLEPIQIETPDTPTSHFEAS